MLAIIILAGELDSVEVDDISDPLSDASLVRMFSFSVFEVVEATTVSDPTVFSEFIDVVSPLLVAEVVI